MANPKLRRTLYIGLGGTGIKVIKEVKKNFLGNTSNALPSMVKFLCIDTNQGDLDGLPSEGPEKLGNLEKLFLTVSQPMATFHADENRYNWIPKSNRDSVSDIQGTGAGQIRSNGKFILEACENNTHALSQRLTDLFNQVTSITAADPNYGILPAANIDVHLIFSIAGGTGSGMFLSVANLIRQYIPNANLMAYAFSPHFFTNAGERWNITHNAYGALLELDYHMHGGKGHYTNIERNITSRLFDSVMYIDKYTYTKDHLENAYTYEFDEVKEIVAHALYLSAGEIGVNALSIVDNLRTAMNSGGYDKACSNGIKGAWVSSVGVSELFCEAKADINYKTIESATSILQNLLNGERAGLTVNETNNWIAELQIDESQGENDGNYLINRVLSANSFQTLKSEGKIIVFDTGEYNDSDFVTINSTNIDRLKQTSSEIAEEKRRLIINKIKDELFPSAGVRTIGVVKLIQVLSGLKSDILCSKNVLQGEISDFASKQEKTSTTIAQKVELIKQEHARIRIIRNEDAIDDAKEVIRKQRVDYYKYQLEIDRRTTAIEVYDALCIFLDSYIDNNSGFLSQLKNNLKQGIERLENEAQFSYRPRVISQQSTSIDLSSRIGRLNTAITEEHPINNWSDFYQELGYFSIENMAPKSDWDITVKTYFCQTHSLDTTGPIIIRVMDTFTREERIQMYKDLINRARPLMEISSFGENISPSEFIFVSYPESSNDALNQFNHEFGEALGNGKFEIIPQKDTNRILVYRQLGVIPPFYIQGISYKKNTIINPQSCEALYLNYINGIGQRRKVKPFTDSFFEDAYENCGHSLGSEFGMYVPKIDLWVDCFILGLIERKGDLYRIEYGGGVIDFEPPFRSWLNLGESRKLAYDAFERADIEFLNYITRKRDELLLNPETSAKHRQFFEVGQDQVNRYMGISLLNYESEEFNDSEVQQLILRECEHLRQH